MHPGLVAISVALLFGAADAAPGPAPNPVATFLRAADANDFAGMQAVLDRGSSGILRKIRGCYLRRVYANNQTHETIAAWMCPEGPNRSRVVLASIGLSRDNKVTVSVQMDQTNDRPAPERTGSAFAD
jgi:hypothetical protein